MREVMLNSVPVTHRPKNTPATANIGTSNIAKTFVKKDQEKKNEKNCCDQNDGETAEGDLLLFIKSAKSVEHAVWNDAGFGQSAFHIADRRAEIAAADARGHCDHVFEIV